MKKLLFLLLVTYYLLASQRSGLIVNSAHAATPTPQDKFQEIKEQFITNIASKVAQLGLVEKRGIIGKVTEATNTQITIIDIQNNTRFIDVDELTKFSSPNTKESYGISDITKNTKIGVLGLYNKESRRILARFVNEVTFPAIIHGGVATVDNENYTISVTTDEGKQMTVDVESITRTFSYTLEEGYIRSGFSKINKNYNIIAVGVLNKTDANRMTATRIIFFPQIPVSPKVNSKL